jgi:hypothetical protein
VPTRYPQSRPRRSLTLLMVAAVHVALVVALLQTLQVTEVDADALEAARGRLRAQVQLLADSVAPDPTAAPPPIAMPEPVRIDLAEPAGLILDPETERLQGLYLGQISARIERAAKIRLSVSQSPPTTAPRAISLR